VAEGKGNSGGEGLSLQTLVLAAVSSAAAAIIVSHLWKGGTVVAAAMTPVIVTILKELLAKPMDSEMVRRPVQQVSRVASSSRRRVAGGAGVRTEGVAPRSTHPPAGPPPTEPRTLPNEPRSGGGVPPTAGDGELTPIRTYGRAPRRRRLHLKIAIITGLVAFLIAAAALTLPELIFGGAISSPHSTTLFGGGSSKKSDKKSKDQGNGSTQPDQSSPGKQPTTPATPPPTTGGNTPPSTTPAPAPQQTTPQQTTPQQTTPVPTTPSPPAP
jgi:hypothetical protein